MILTWYNTVSHSFSGGRGQNANLRPLCVRMDLFLRPASSQLGLTTKLKNLPLIKAGLYSLVTAGGFEPPTLRAEI